MENLIDIQHLSCKIGNRYILKDISWQIAPQDHWVIFGTNGSGKTTLLSIIAGFRHFTSGNISFCGLPYNKENILTIRKQIGFVSSSFFNLYYSKENVLDIIVSGKTGTLSLDDTVGFDDYLKAQKLLRSLHLDSKMDMPFDMLSKGERQLVLIARALMDKPAVLILDEPMDGLDIYNREYLFKLFYELAQQNIVLLYVTHHADEITSLFNQALLLKKGNVFAQGSVGETFISDQVSGLLDMPAVISTDDITQRKKIQLDIPQKDIRHVAQSIAEGVMLHDSTKN